MVARCGAAVGALGVGGDGGESRLSAGPRLGGGKGDTQLRSEPPDKSKHRENPGTRQREKKKTKASD